MSFWLKWKLEQKPFYLKSFSIFDLIVATHFSKRLTVKHETLITLNNAQRLYWNNL